MVYKAAIVYMNDVQFTALKHEHGYFFGVSILCADEIEIYL